jgi:hypothetical protein
VEQLLNAIHKLSEASPLLSLVIVGATLIVYAWNERRKVTSPDTNGSGVSLLRSTLDRHIEMTASHFAVVEDRVAENYEEFLRFQVAVARELATKVDLSDAEKRIKEHITSTFRIPKR